MRVSPESRPLTTIAIPGKGLYQWKVMPLPYADVYVNDVIIGSTGETKQDLLNNHAQHLDEVLSPFA